MFRHHCIRHKDMCQNVSDDFQNENLNLVLITYVHQTEFPSVYVMECLSACKQTHYELYWSLQTPTSFYESESFSDTRANFVNSLFSLLPLPLYIILFVSSCVFFFCFGFFLMIYNLSR